MANEKGKTEQAKALPINDAASYMGMKPQYVRTLIRGGKFKPNKVKISPETKVWRWEIPIEQLDAHMANAGTRSRRADGRSKYVLYATDEELETLKTVTPEGVVIDRAYKPKPKAEATTADVKEATA